jgi:hypothetical protein
MLDLTRRDLFVGVTASAAATLAPSLPALRCAARLQPWRCGLTT